MSVLLYMFRVKIQQLAIENFLQCVVLLGFLKLVHCPYYGTLFFTRLTGQQHPTTDKRDGIIV